MKLPKREKVTNTITLFSAELYKDVERYLCYKEERYFDNIAQVKVKVKASKEYRKTVRDIKAFCRVFNRLSRHGWKVKEEERAEQ